MDVNELQAWRVAAERHLDAQAERARRYQLYFDGEEAVPVILDTTERQAFRAFLREAGANWCELVANAVAERLQVVGFRFAGTGGDDAWAIWQANQMDADAELVQSDALVCGSSFVLVQPDPDNPSGVEMTAESPLEATVLYEPGSRRRRAAGYKRFGGEEFGRHTEVLILPDVIATWHADQTGPPEQAPNPAGAVGLIEIAPQPRTRGWPRSELHSCIPIQDRINTVLFARLVATDYSAFRQIWATGVKIARNTVTSADGTEVVRPVAPYDIGANRLLTNENPEGRFGSFPESALRGYLDSVEQDVNQMAAITQNPAALPARANRQPLGRCHQGGRGGARGQGPAPLASHRRGVGDRGPVRPQPHRQPGGRRPRGRGDLGRFRDPVGRPACRFARENARARGAS